MLLLHESSARLMHRVCLAPVATPPLQRRLRWTFACLGSTPHFQLELMRPRSQKRPAELPRTIVKRSPEALGRGWVGRGSDFPCLSPVLKGNTRSIFTGGMEQAWPRAYYRWGVCHAESGRVG